MNDGAVAHERAVVRAYRTGALVGLVLFLVVLSGARWTLLAWSPGADFYDAQADAFLDGDLHVEPERLGIEGFESDGRTYMYQPPWPALLRVPVALASDGYDGRLAAVSMLGALLVALAATQRLLVAARRAIRGGAPASSLESGLAFGVGLVVAGGSVPTFLASRPWVYHEAALWGLAWTLAAMAALVSLRRHPSWGRWAALTGATAAAVGSRASVGAGACAAIGVLAVATLVERRDEPWVERLRRPAGAVALLMAAALPALAYAGLNVAKFGSVASIPFEDQVFTRLSPARQAMLAENEGTLFGLRFAPTTALHYLRPDGIDIDRQFPFVDFPEPGGPVVGDVTFDLVDRTASIPASLPALLVPAVVGVVVVARRKLDDAALWGALLVGGLVGTATIVPFGYVAHRYVADAVPLLVPMALLGLASIVTWTRSRSSRSWRERLGRPAIAVAAVVLAVATTWTNVSLATLYQRLYVPNPDPDLTAGLIDARLTVGAPPAAQQVGTLPPVAASDELAAIGDCEALYVWDGTPVGEFRADAWIPVERTFAAGHVEADLDMDSLKVGRRHPLLATADGPVVLWLERTDDGSVRAGLDAPGTTVAGLPVQPTGRRSLDLVIDPHLGDATVRLGDQILVTGPVPRGTDVSALEIGAAAGLAGYAATTPLVPAAPVPGSLCAEAVAP